MRYILNGPLKEYRNKRRTDKTRTKLTETALTSPTSVHTNRTKHITRFDRKYISFEAIVIKLIFRFYNILAAGLYQVRKLQMGVILPVSDGEI